VFANASVIWAVIRSRRAVLLGTAGLFLAAGLLYGWLAPERYRAVATLFLDAAADGAGSASLKRSDLDLLRSDRVAMRVAVNERLAEEPSLRPVYLGAVEASQQPLDALAHAIAGDVSAAPAGEGGIVQLAVTTSEPALAARIANGYARAWGEVATEIRAASMREAVERARRDLVSLRARLGEARARLGGGAVAESTDGGAADARFAEVSRLATRALHRSAAGEDGGDAMEEARAAASETGLAPGGGAMPLEARAVQSESAGDPAPSAAQGAADDDIRMAQHSLERAEDRLARLAAEGAGVPFPIHVLVSARTPEQSVKPSLLQCALAAAAGGLLAGLIAAFCVEAMDRRVRGERDVAGALGLVVLGNLPDTSARLPRVPVRAWEEPPRARLAG
jgi:polysaccharide biosynthesis transport protein